VIFRLVRAIFWYHKKNLVKIDGFPPGEGRGKGKFDKKHGKALTEGRESDMVLSKEERPSPVDNVR